mmetsp:Transcript_10891/g.33393  ORF Transcript_10891/g.33393 Transcript_10891/m.33393 type:complete len:368 (+) Transcript_10891:204-1307(+)|eukprot:CAMPEP_0198727792 /NCGR_PEP_ID=MMETSP1475-20131203/5281_1 /TAXON_ID= ORGANISM="Unidentified sp., Strain CCMP1999" /NCGR_SAMPLE_ID=MMETSP1475 /ASSEMBLY_ACC=CAM_ASM_001111 /LENGTH=367 /DNA_ID=CAMNT_0044489933 /DNA_START=133 /DNA_END=1236 /DNA_ORIENTATION=-
MDQLNSGGAGNPQGGSYYGASHHPGDMSHFRQTFYEGPSGHGEANLGHDTYGAQGTMDGVYGGTGADDNGGSMENLDKPRSSLRTLPAVLARYVRQQNKPVTEEELYEEVRKVYMDLRKPDGTKYTGNLERAVRGSLCSTGLFDKLDDGTWTLKEEQTQEYERRLIDRQAKQEAERSKKRKARDESVGTDRPRRYTRRSSTPGVRTKRQHKKEAIIEMVTQFSETLKTQNDWSQCFSNPFKGFRGDEKEDDVWKKLGNEKFIFMLQIYNYLQDLIVNRNIVSEALAKEKAQAKAEKAGKKRAQNEESHPKQKSRQEPAVTPQQLASVGKIATSLEDSIMKLNSRISSVEETLASGQLGGFEHVQRSS